MGDATNADDRCVVNGGSRSPFAWILWRYLVEEFLRILGLCLVAFIVVYLIADFSDRIDDFLKHQAPVGAVVRYFLVRIPLIVNDVLPIAVLAAMLLGLGGLSRHNVDLHLKFAVPFICTLMGLISMPLGMRNLRGSSLANNIGAGLLIGSTYWFVLALAVSLGHSGALPPIVAAWTANGIFAAIGLFLLLGAV
jgi:lipopolysaccharide export LptBFGC system permease protein LptF